MFETLIGLYLITFNEFGDSATIANSDKTILHRVRRIVGGDLTYIDQVPYIVSIRRDGTFECGGSLITPNCVLTAAHCVKNGSPENFIVRGGVTYLNDKRNSRRVDNIFLPTRFDNKTLEYDVAIFELRTPFSDPAIETIELAEDHDMPEMGDLIRVSGWGLTSETAKRPSNRLRTIEVNVMPQSECREMYRSYRNVTSQMFCASVPGLKDACSADSGGPAVANGKLVGLVSWGKGYECARVNSPGVYVNIAAVRHWIDEVLENVCF